MERPCLPRRAQMRKSDNVYGYAGKLLRINLTNGNISTGSTMDYAKEWLGISGIAAKILYDELSLG